MNHLRQPSFYHVAGACAAIALVVCASRDPHASAPFVARTWEALSRVLVYAVSIALAAGPFALVGALVATCAVRLPAKSWPAAIALAALCPGCDCSMNGFVDALRHCPPPLAGAALMWGAACNPAALLATLSVLGPRALLARAVGGAVAATTVALLWSMLRGAHKWHAAARACAMHAD
ncbi:MAG: hypothetical protein JO219_04615, partial [Candidatus Eremiobacteraeota bacterium]|nr:hypothetical protein [Candidatus Eremiobacteraeota bacterium]